MNNEVKVYEIGGLRFTLGPLSFKRLRLASQFEQSLRKLMQRIDSVDHPSNVMEFTLQLENAILSDEMIEFLLTILTQENEQWTEAHSTEQRNAMMEIDEGTLQTVLSDFFSRNNRGKKDKASATENSNES